MARFKDLGFKSFEDYVRNFFDTLMNILLIGRRSKLKLINISTNFPC